MVDEIEKKLRAAERAHDRIDEIEKIHADQIDSFANTALKNLTITSLGGIAAALGFYSANYARLTGQPENLWNFNITLVLMFSSLIFGLISPSFAYLSQFCFQRSYNYTTKTDSDPYIVYNTLYYRFNDFGNAFLYMSVGSAVLSIVLIAASGVFFIRLL